MPWVRRKCAEDEVPPMWVGVATNNGFLQRRPQGWTLAQVLGEPTLRVVVAPVATTLGDARVKARTAPGHAVEVRKWYE